MKEEELKQLLDKLEILNQKGEEFDKNPSSFSEKDITALKEGLDDSLEKLYKAIQDAKQQD